MMGEMMGRDDIVGSCEMMCGAGACNDITSDDFRHDDQCQRNSFHEYISCDHVRRHDFVRVRVRRVTSMLETKRVGDKFVMLVIDSRCWRPI